jgi:hypothetical protein
VLAHHNSVVLFQGNASSGLAGWDTTIGTRRYSILHRRTAARLAALSAYLESDHSA